MPLKTKTAQDLEQLDLLAIMVKEDMTNAVWNKILHDIFKAPDFLISPEYHFHGKRQADLAVIVMKVERRDQENLLNKPLVVFEGKKRGGHTGSYTLGDALKQAKDCLVATGSQSGIAIASLGIYFGMTLVNDTASCPAGFIGNLGGRYESFDVSQNVDQIVRYLTVLAKTKSRPVPGGW